MKTLTAFSTPRVVQMGIILFFFLPSNISVAQTSPLCTDEDCSPAVFNISLDAPLNGPIPPQRTEQYKTAYLELKRLKAGYSSKPGWQDKNEEGLLVGKGCLRQYQLESRFAYEYEQNPAFKTFITQQERDVEAFREEGFESSRRAINLTRRMESNCKNELKEVEKAAGPSLEELPEEYQKLGQALGYFDENNKMLKPFKSDEKKAAKASNNPSSNSASANPTQASVGNDPKLSKKEQIAQLKDKVSKLPLGIPMKDKITGIVGDLKAAKPKLGFLGNLLGGILKSKLATFLPGPLGILGKIKAGLGILKALNIFKPKKPKPELASKIDNLNKKGEELAKKAQDAVGKANKLQETLDQLSQKTTDLQKEIEKREAKIAEMDQTLADLEKKKAELAAELEDNPRRQLEEIKPQVDDLAKQSEELAEKAETEKQDKDKLLDQVEAIAKEKDQLETDLQKQENELQTIAKETEQLEQDIQTTNADVEKVKAEEADEEAVAEMGKQIDQLPSEEKWKNEIKICESDLAKLLGKVKGMEALQDKAKKKATGLFALPAKLMEKVSNLKVVQNTLKLGKKGIPIGEKALAKLDGLLAKGTALGATLELITGKKSKLQEKLESYDQKLDIIQKGYASKVANLDNLKAELLKIVEEKTGLKSKLGQKVEDVKSMEAKVKDFIERYDIFDKKDKCVSLADLEGKIEDLKKEQESAEPEAEQLEQEINNAAQEEQKLETETQVVEQEIDETTEKAEELKAEETAIKEEFGQDLDLKPVPVEEWAESFEVQRPYWDAVFHPDDEVVEGYKGRYFKVRLKDASKSVKLLFKAGDYYMEKSLFRKNYGSTIGAFVSEALNSMKKADRGKVQLFIQGSADITGQNTFSGKLNEQYLFDKVSVLPQKTDQEHFSNAPVVKDIPANGFRNTHLPDLRARFLKEMIAAYSKKFDPILLEGTVKKFQDKEERNAVIYLFFPEEMLKEYEK